MGTEQWNKNSKVGKTSKIQSVEPRINRLVSLETQVKIVNNINGIGGDKVDVISRSKVPLITLI